ncbi:MAG: DUF2892 domain-containing protein [Rickettsiales bacterium]|nr:DUF2892 domain-containing protein [Rickettsiales bacterium]
MKCNVGGKDRKIRFGAGFVLLLLGIIIKHPIFFLLSGVAVITGFLKFCPAYFLLKKSTIDKN